jgi:threonine dehydrogenase-like Zn-dependent dehydrogenase
MKAIQIVSPGNAAIVDLPEPKVSDGEVLVEVKACVTCPQWDLTLFRGVDIFTRPGYPRYPIPVGFPGHEMSGVILAVGRAVQNLRVGDRVATLRTAGEDQSGFYAERVAVREDLVVRIPESVTHDAAASMEMARHVSPYVRDLGDVTGRRVGVTGLGPAGLIALQMIRAAGATQIVALDLVPARLELARTLGATEVVRVDVPADLERLEKRPLGACIDCSGSAAGAQVGLDHTEAGRVSLFGVVHGELRYGTRHWRREVSIVRASGPTSEDTALVISLWSDGRLDTGALVSARLPFEQYAEGVALLAERRAVKVSFHPGMG